MSIPVIAQEAYPSRPVKFVVPFTAGGPLDVMARLMAQKLAEQWGKPVVVENQAGGSGSIGAAAVARAPADGYTLLVTVDIPLHMYPAVAQAVRSGLKQVMNDQTFRARLSDMGTEPVWDEAETVSNAIAADLMRWRELARVAKIEAPQ